MKKQIVIILRSVKMGGTQKRFLRLWIFFQEIGYTNIKLIITQDFYEQAIRVDEFKSITKFDAIILPTKKFRYFIPSFINLISSFPEDTVFHCVMGFVPLVYTLLRRKLILTFPTVRFNREMLGISKMKMVIYYWFPFWEAWKIDVLSQYAQQQIKRLPFVKSNKVVLTPGSFVDTKIYQPNKTKKNWLVFLGRFDSYGHKNVVKFVKSIPYIFEYLRENGIEDVKFFILGYGYREKDVRNLLQTSKYQNIPIKCYYELNPQEVLSQSKVFYSLQKVSNYPSKSLLEALSCGNLCIVTDVGDSQLIAKEPFAFFVNEQFKEQDLAKCTLLILKMDMKDFWSRVNKSLDFINKHYEIEKVAEYYLKLYELKSLI